MKVTSNSNLLSSLTSLLDPSQRQQQQIQQDQQDNTQKQKNADERTNKVARQNNIDANRDALKQLQERLKSDKLEKLKSERPLENLDDQSQNQGASLNLRENLGQRNKPVNSRPGQIIDIRV